MSVLYSAPGFKEDIRRSKGTEVVAKMMKQLLTTMLAIILHHKSDGGFNIQRKMIHERGHGEEVFQG